MADRSRTALLDFLDYLAAKGLMAKATVAARKAAATQMLGILEQDEASDVTALDLDQVVHRFQNLHGKKYTPQSLTTYKSRVKAAIDDFTAYSTNPLAFRPSVQSRERSKTKNGKQVSSSKAPDVAEPAKNDTNPRPVHSAVASSNILPIPLRADLTVFIQGLPFDLTPQEARKISNVVLAMAPHDL
jgi:GH25 family lysozyme M1 (1,4-beta-N-acetylmuramidase)